MEKTEAEWQRLEGERQKFNRGEALEHVGNESFIPDKECVCCIDERVASRNTFGGEEVGGRWFVAGSGILLPVELWEERAKVAAAEAYRRGIKRFSYHAGCGAAELAVKADAEQFADREKFEANPSLHAEQFSKRAQAELNRLTGLDEEVLFVPKEEIVPSEFHNAIGAVVDATGEFNPHTLSDGEPLRRCFMLDWKSGSELPLGPREVGYNLRELRTAVNIAFDHGFRSHFDTKNPFNIVVMARNEEQLKLIEDEVNAYISSNFGPMKERVRVIPYSRATDK